MPTTSAPACARPTTRTTGTASGGPRSPTRCPSAAARAAPEPPAGVTANGTRSRPDQTPTPPELRGAQALRDPFTQVLRDLPTLLPRIASLLPARPRSAVSAAFPEAWHAA